MKQHLAEFLNKDLIKKVNWEANKIWSKTPTIPIPRFKAEKADKKRKAWGLLMQLKP